MDTPEELGKNLRSLRKGAGLTAARLRTTPLVLSALGTESPVDALEKLRMLLLEMGDGRYAEAARNAFGLGPSKADVVTARRNDLSTLRGVSYDTIEDWENRGIRELAERIASNGNVVTLVPKTPAPKERGLSPRDIAEGVSHRQNILTYQAVVKSRAITNLRLWDSFFRADKDGWHHKSGDRFTAEEEHINPSLHRNMLFLVLDEDDARQFDELSLYVEFFGEVPKRIAAYGPIHWLDFNLGIATPVMQQTYKPRVRHQKGRTDPSDGNQAVVRASSHLRPGQVLTDETGWSVLTYDWKQTNLLGQPVPEQFRVEFKSPKDGIYLVEWTWHTDERRIFVVPPTRGVASTEDEDA